MATDTGPAHNERVTRAIDSQDVDAPWSRPVGELAALYGGNFSLRPPGLGETLGLATLGAVLGWLGAQLSVSLSLRKLD